MKEGKNRIVLGAGREMFLDGGILFEVMTLMFGLKNKKKPAWQELSRKK